MNPHPNFCTKVYVSPHGVNHETWMKHESSRQKLAPVHGGLTSHPRFTSHPRSRVGRGMNHEGLRMSLDPEKNDLHNSCVNIPINYTTLLTVPPNFSGSFPSIYLFKFRDESVHYKLL